MNLYFTTQKDSATGLKIQDFLKRFEAANDIAEKLADKYGFQEYRTFSRSMITGISSVIFDKEPDLKIWRKVRENEYAPILSHKVGKTIKMEFDTIPKIHRRDINDCIGWDGDCLFFIGLNFNSTDYFGIVTNEKWNISMPNDCKETSPEHYALTFDVSSEI